MQVFLRKFFINVHNILIFRVVIRRGDSCGRPRLIGRSSMICLVVALIPWATTRNPWATTRVAPTKYCILFVFTKKILEICRLNSITKTLINNRVHTF